MKNERIHPTLKPCLKIRMGRRFQHGYCPPGPPKTTFETSPGIKASLEKLAKENSKAVQNQIKQILYNYIEEHKCID